MFRKIRYFKPFFLFAVPFIFILGSILHFAYDFFNQNPIVGLIVPINESIWEHTKLLFFPTVLWYTLYYFFSGKKLRPNYTQWLTSCTLSVIVGILSIPLIFYFYTEAFGIELLIVDILILLFSVALGQITAHHSYIYSFSIKQYISISILIFIAILYIIFSLFPPSLPLFSA